MRTLCLLVAVALLGSGSAARAADDAPPPAGAAAAAPAPAAPPPAAASTAPSPPPPTVENTPRKRFRRLSTPSLTHHDQLGLSLLPGVGYRIIVPYQQGISCGQDNRSVCTGKLPFFLDGAVSFGFSEHWDVLLDLRFGLETDFTQSRELAVAPGVRYWVDPDLMVKFFATIQGVYDATTQNNSAVRGSDFGVRNANGLMIEVMRNLGFYLQFGETIGLARWLRFEIDGGLGVQARMP